MPRPVPALPSHVEEYRDERWCRDVTRLVRSGSAGAIPAAGLADGGRLVADWRFGKQLVFRVDHSGVRINDLVLAGRTLTGRLMGAAAEDVRAVTVSGPGGRPTAPVVDGRFTLTIPRVGPLLRDWRQRRRLSQLDLAVGAGVSARHVSFVETGRARPSAEMVMQLAEHLDVPLRLGGSELGDRRVQQAG